jgi:two-component system, sensor histidine kinase RegB
VFASSDRVKPNVPEAAPDGVLRPISVVERLESPRFGLLWLVRLRWHALVALAVAMTLAPWLMGVSVPWFLALALVSGIGLSNVLSLLWVRSGRAVHPAALGGVVLVDTALLTAALALSGGLENPFVSLYVVQVTLAALLCDVYWVAAVGGACVAGYALLHGQPTPLFGAPAVESSLVALAITLGIDGTLVVRMVLAFRERQEALARAQREVAQAEKLTSLATLAAGAAHELATPLGTIAVAATELLELIETAPRQAREEAIVIRDQVARCKHILQRLGARAGSEPGELSRRATAAELFALVRRDLGWKASRLDTAGDPLLELCAPVESLAAVLANFASNGLSASPEGAHVQLSASVQDGMLRFTTRDQGTGIEPELLPRLGEPFFTTKPPGEGLGLGLFLAYRFAAACRGRLWIESAAEGGSAVHLDLPASGGTA